MSRHPLLSGWARAALGALLLLATAAGCDEDGSTAPERCLDRPLPIFSIASAGVPGDDNARYNDDGSLPCVTEIGHAISPSNPTPSAGSGSGGTAGSAAAGAASGGDEAGSGSDAGAGGA